MIVIPADVTRWRADSARSRVGFSVRHMMFTTVRGSLAAPAVWLAADPRDPTTARVEARIEAASISTADARRDEHLRSADFLDVARYPVIVFRSTEVRRAEQDRLAVHGLLTIRGVTREVTLEVSPRDGASWGRTPLAVRAATRIQRKDFGLQWNRALETGGVLVGETVQVVIELLLLPVPGP